MKKKIVGMILYCLVLPFLLVQVIAMKQNPNGNTTIRNIGMNVL